ncbi:hypothetical protein ACHAWO_008290 [Cyclotella atomus]|uniref:Anaphase-promoting complex subunit 13 n=1 Tax=Cyclotella atomus TaxID=382360 RepID=A0ABD3MXK1_9STRA
MSDSSSVTVNKLRRPYPGTSRPSNLDIVDAAWAADKLSDDELELEKGEAAIAQILEDEGEMDDAVVTTANSGSAASGAAERRRKVDGRWNDLGLDLFDNGNGGNGVVAQPSASGGQN